MRKAGEVTYGDAHGELKDKQIFTARAGSILNAFLQVHKFMANMGRFILSHMADHSCYNKILKFLNNIMSCN